MKHSHPIFSGTVWLTGALLLLRSIGLLYQILLAKVFTATELGELELFMAVYGFATTLAVSGVRLSSTRLIIIGETRGYAPQCVLKKTVVCSLLFGITAMAFLWLFAPFASQSFLSDASLTSPLRTLALCLPILSAESCFGGYYTAIGKATTFTLIQVPQQLISLVLCTILLHNFLSFGLHIAYTALAAGLLISELIGLILIITFLPRNYNPSNCNGNMHLSDFFQIALPDAGSSWLRSALVATKNIMIPRGLQQASGDSSSALATYGTIQSMTFPVLSFPSVFVSAFNTQMLPEISRCHESNQRKLLQKKMRRNCLAVLIYALICSTLIFVSADWLGNTLYPESKVSTYLRLLAPLIPLMYLDTTVDTFLRGMGLQVSSMFYNIIDAAVCLSMVLVLLPRIGITGYILMLYTSEFLNLFLSLHKLQTELYSPVQYKTPVN